MLHEPQRVSARGHHREPPRVHLGVGHRLLHAHAPAAAAAPGRLQATTQAGRKTREKPRENAPRPKQQHKIDRTTDRTAE